MKKAICMLAGAALSMTAFAYLPPEASGNGACLRIETFDETSNTNATWHERKLVLTVVDADRPREIPFRIENRSAREMTGVLRTWVNDDWALSGPAEEQLRLAPGESRRVVRTATARADRILNAIYPVHASFAVAGAKPLHAIALFRAKTAHPALVNAKTPRAPFAPIEGEAAAAPTEAEWRTRESAAVAAAKAALRDGGNAKKGSWRLSGGRNGTWGAALVPGARGPVDGVLALTDGRECLAWRGFTCEVNGVAVKRWTDQLKLSVVSDRGSLRLRWEMPGVTRSADGYPRYTKLALGPCTHAAGRAYAGFGNVIENPRNFDLKPEGFILSTRHAGADYPNGLSLVQATDLIPDLFLCRRDEKVLSLVASHDATFTLVPSVKGAFAAARAFADVCGYRKGPGVDALLGRQCLDYWGGTYEENAAALELEAKYGLTDSILVRHTWQCWGYDYRLPEIYPPQGDRSAFDRMVRRSKAAGILFCLHDNYIDFYPDAEGFSYDQMVFNLDGTPQKAWFNAGRFAQSYRFAADAFKPHLVRNMRLLRDNIDPDAIFIDVFSAVCPMDYLDRKGRFHTKNETSFHWGDAFDTCRRELMHPTAPMISEAGQDHIVGHLDAGQSDHFFAERWMARSEFADSERTPWHDIVTHGKFVLFAGGIAGRYAAPKWHAPADLKNHGYGTDDYLCNTVIGGRNPMSDGRFNRATVLTYWLLHDICADLARADLEDVTFGENIHRQHSVFSDGGEVWINRSTNDTWSVAGVTLPHYGFRAKAPGLEAGIVRKGDATVGYATREGCRFVDARGRETDFGGIVTDGSFRLECPKGKSWRLVPLPEGGAFRATLDLAGAKVRAVKALEAAADAAAPVWKQEGDRLTLAVDAKAFGYEITFGEAK